MIGQCKVSTVCIFASFLQILDLHLIFNADNSRLDTAPSSLLCLISIGKVIQIWLNFNLANFVSICQIGNFNSMPKFLLILYMANVSSGIPLNSEV